MAAHEDRCAGAGGIAAVAAVLVALFLLPADSGGESAADIAARHSDGREKYLRAAFEGLSVAFLMVFESATPWRGEEAASHFCSRALLRSAEP